MHPSLSTYRLLCRLPFPKSYLGKFLLVAFIGVHVPLIALVVFVSIRSEADWATALPWLGVALVATLVGTGATLLVQRALLAPMLLTAKALEAYRRQRTLPDLPVEFPDEAGALMSHTQGCVQHLEALLQAKRDLIGIISHDTRNPLTQIMMANDLAGTYLREERPNIAGALAMNAMVRRAAEWQQKQLEDLMGLVRSEQEAMEINADKTDVRDFLETIVDNASLQATTKNVTLRFEDLSSAAGGLLLVAAKTAQVLNNLVHNSLKFTPSGGTVSVTAKRGGGPDGGNLQFIVEDTGIGMNQEIRNGLFMPFTKVGRKGTNDEPSSGLGLSICKTFVEAQGGTLEVWSEEGQGSRFTIYLPWRAAPQEGTRTAAPKLGAGRLVDVEG